MSEDEPDGATPLEPGEAEDLLPTHIHTRTQLNLWEQENILEAVSWVRRTRTPALSEPTIRELHRRMFGQTWGWAGRYRTSDKNIGVYWATIPGEIRNLIDDAHYWFAHQVYTADEGALRLHHRLVKIHPFPNGNGRHGRLWCDMLLRQKGRPPRRAYFAALQAADGQDYAPLFRLILRGRPSG
jgi:Fic-DOC domain mobile mystery protein B